MGVNIAKQSFEVSGISISPDAIIGINAALLYNLPLSGNLSLQPELSFVQKGSKIDDPSGDDAKLTLNYIEVPVLLKYSSASEGTRFFGQAGPSFGYAISGKNKVGDQSEDVEFGDDATKRADLGLHIGAGVGFGNVFIDARYVLGLANIVDDSDVTVRNRGILISLGYMF